MDFEFTDEQTMFRNMAREFAEREILPVVRDDELQSHFRPEIIKKLGALGLMGAPVPQEYGGLGIDYITYLMICEEIGRASAGVITTFGVHISLFQMPILRFGSEPLKRKYLPRTTKGELLGCFCCTEPNVGSDVSSIETRAAKKGDRWLLNGNKMWISNGGVADLALVFAQTDRAKRHRGIAAFLLEKGTPGFSSRDIHDKMGMRDSNTAELIFQDAEVPEENVVGDVGDGFKVAMYALDCARLSAAAGCVGLAQSSIDAAVQYAKERTQFGKPIGRFQLVQEMIADVVAETEVARWFVYRCGDLKNKGQFFAREASIAKYYAAEVAIRAARMAIKVHGGYGYSTDYPAERNLRSAIGMSLYEGTAEIQKLIIGRETLGMAAFV